jgi:hypothetical protein
VPTSVDPHHHIVLLRLVARLEKVEEEVFAMSNVKITCERLDL